MTIKEICLEAEKVAKQFNPDGIAPFPFEKITEKYSDLKIVTPTGMPAEYSGAIILQEGIYFILVNKAQPEKRQYFTIAHELGHYFLHKDYLATGKQILDFDYFTKIDATGALYRQDSKEVDTETKRLEVEANNFAASLIMPAKLVKNAWEVTEGSIEACAEIFKVSTVAMSVRLERLRLVD